LAQRKELLKERVAIEMKRYFKQDFKRIGHAANVARYAEQIVKGERGDPAVVLCAAYLHDIGIHEAERRYKSTAAEHHEEEGPPIAREILKRLGATEDLIEEVCDIIGHHHHPRDEETLNFNILHDADLVVNLEEKQKKAPIDREELVTLIERSFQTGGGRQLAESILLRL
jgi:putative nucleotidyltransferase with HDIG domain